MILLGTLLFFTIFQGSSLTFIGSLTNHSSYHENKQMKCIISLVINLISSEKQEKFAFTVNVELDPEVPVIKWNIQKPFVWDKSYKIPLYVIHASDDLEQILKLLEEKECLYPRATFIIITENVDKGIFKTLSKSYIASAGVVDKTGKIFTYNPYMYENINEPNLKYTKSNCFAIGKVLDNLSPTGKYPKKWRNSTITLLHFPVSPYVFPCVNCTDFDTVSGVEVEIYQIIRNKMGFKVIPRALVADEWGVKVNGSYTDGLGLLQNDTVQVMIGACNVYAREHLDFDISTSYSLETCHWLVPRTEPIVTWTVYLKIFTKYLWLLNLFTLFSVTVVLYFNIGDFNRGLFTVLQILTESGVYGYHKTFKSVRPVLTLFTLCALVISTVFKNQIFVILSSEKMRNSIENFDELLASDIRIIITPRTADVMSISKEPRDIELYKRYQPTPHLTHVDMINEVAFAKDAATISIRGMVLYLILEYYIDSNGDPRLYILDRPSYNLHVQSFFVKGYPMVDTINKYLKYNVENGIISKKKRDKEYDMTNDIYRKQIYVFGARALDLEDLRWYFYVLAGGLTFSILIFFAEIVFHKFVNNPFQRRLPWLK